jgi:hypothetical protein
VQTLRIPYSGAGVFGQRLVRGVLQSTDWDITIGGRDPGRMADCVQILGRVDAAGLTRLHYRALDTRTVGAEQLRALGAFAVADTAGPYNGTAG